MGGSSLLVHVLNVFLYDTCVCDTVYVYMYLYFRMFFKSVIQCDTRNLYAQRAIVSQIVSLVQLVSIEIAILLLATIVFLYMFITLAPTFSDTSDTCHACSSSCSGTRTRCAYRLLAYSVHACTNWCTTRFICLCVCA